MEGTKKPSSFYELLILKKKSMEHVLTPNKKAIVTLGNGTINQIAESLKMTFITKKELNSNICFVNSDELRPEYKDLFTLENLYDYLYAVWYSITQKENTNEGFTKIFKNIPLPTDKKKFWELVYFGKELREEL